MKQELKDVISKFQDVFQLPNEDVMISGTHALKICGLLPHREPHDIDLVVRVDKEIQPKMESFMLVLGEITMGEKDSVIHGSTSDVFIFKCGGFVFNIWIVNDRKEFNTTLKDSETGLWVERPIDVLNMKKKYGREKDKDDLLSITASILQTGK